MAHQLTSSEKLLYSTVHIGSANKSAAYHGTGFFYNVILPEHGTVPLLITNKHVIGGCDRVVVHLHRLGDDGGPAGWSRVTIGLRPGGIAEHPDPEVDLCGISLDLGTLGSAGFKPFSIQLDKSIIPSKQEWDDFDALEQVLMVGCPNGLYDQINNLPIFRRGVTSSHPAKKFNGAEEFLIDAACFPGSSGSPVFLYDAIGYQDKSSGEFMLGKLRIKLLGILYAGPTITQDGRVILNKQPQVSFDNMMHLGQVIRSTRLLDLERVVVDRLKEQGAI